MTRVQQTSAATLFIAVLILGGWAWSQDASVTSPSNLNPAIAKPSSAEVEEPAQEVEEPAPQTEEPEDEELEVEESEPKAVESPPEAETENPSLDTEVPLVDTEEPSAPPEEPAKEELKAEDGKMATETRKTSAVDPDPDPDTSVTTDEKSSTDDAKEGSE
jgi:hypothetical protein